MIYSAKMVKFSVKKTNASGEFEEEMVRSKIGR